MKYMDLKIEKCFNNKNYMKPKTLQLKEKNVQNII